MTEMPFEELEAVYEHLVKALDAVGEDRHALLLARLVMILAWQSGDIHKVDQAIRDAAAEMGGPTGRDDVRHESG